jgi:hypothetical protein
MPKRALAVLTASLVALAVLESCSDTEEVLPEALDTVTARPSGSPSATPMATAAPTPTETKSPAPTPSVGTDWKQYTDPVLGFAFRYPPDLVATDVTGVDPQGEFGERVVELRSTEPSRSFSVSIFERNPRGLTLDEFAEEFICTRDRREGEMANARAIYCVKEVLEGFAHPAVVSEHSGKFIEIQAGAEVSDAEFSTVIQSFRS